MRAILTLLSAGTSSGGTSLPIGAIIGIVIAVVVITVVLVLVLVGVTIIYRCMHKKKPPQSLTALNEIYRKSGNVSVALVAYWLYR